MQSQPTTTLAGCLPFGKYAAARPDVFPSIHSAIWFEWQNRARLAKKGATLIVRGSLWAKIPRVRSGDREDRTEKSAKRAQRVA